MNDLKNSIAMSTQTHTLQPGRELIIHTGGNVFEILSPTGDVEVKLGNGDFNRLPASLVVGDPDAYFEDLVLRNVSDQPNTIEVYIGTGDPLDNRFVASGVVDVWIDGAQRPKVFRPLLPLTIRQGTDRLVAATNPNREKLMIFNAGGATDTFLFTNGDGNDTIVGFEDGIDQIAFAGSLTSADLSITADDNGHVKVNYRARNTILLLDAGGMINEADFAFNCV